MVTTFVRSAGNRTKELWQFIEEASRADVMSADMRHYVILVTAARMAVDEWLYIVLLNGSANLAGWVPLEYIEQHDRSLPHPKISRPCAYHFILKWK